MFPLKQQQSSRTLITALQHVLKWCLHNSRRDSVVTYLHVVFHDHCVQPTVAALRLLFTLGHHWVRVGHGTLTHSRHFVQRSATKVSRRNKIANSYPARPWWWRWLSMLGTGSTSGGRSQRWRHAPRTESSACTGARCHDDTRLATKVWGCNVGSRYRWHHLNMLIVLVTELYFSSHRFRIICCTATANRHSLSVTCSLPTLRLAAYRRRRKIY